MGTLHTYMINMQANTHTRVHKADIQVHHTHVNTHKQHIHAKKKFCVTQAYPYIFINSSSEKVYMVIIFTIKISITLAINSIEYTIQVCLCYTVE